MLRNLRENWRWFLMTFVVVIAVHNVLDIGKWAIGRYTEIGLLLSIGIMFVFSLVFTIILEVVNYYRRKAQKKYVIYDHHGHEVWVRKDLQGGHWEPTICLACTLFLPETPDNCPTAQMLFELCKEHHLVIVPWECPEFDGGSPA